MRIGSLSINAVKKSNRLETNSRIAAIKAKTVMASTSLRVRPSIGDMVGKGCGAFAASLFVPSS